MTPLRCAFQNSHSLHIFHFGKHLKYSIEHESFIRLIYMSHIIWLIFVTCYMPHWFTSRQTFMFEGLSMFGSFGSTAIIVKINDLVMICYFRLVVSFKTFGEIHSAWSIKLHNGKSISAGKNAARQPHSAASLSRKSFIFSKSRLNKKCFRVGPMISTEHS